VSDSTLLAGFPTFLGYDCTYSSRDGSFEVWFSCQSLIIQHLHLTKDLCGFMLIVPVPWRCASASSDPIAPCFSRAFCSEWSVSVNTEECSSYGDAIYRQVILVRGFARSLPVSSSVLRPLSSQESSLTSAPAYGPLLDHTYREADDSSFADLVAKRQPTLPDANSQHPQVCSVLTSAAGTTQPIMVLHPGGPACVPGPCDDSPFSGRFAVPFRRSDNSLSYRPCSTPELFSMLSMDRRASSEISLLAADLQAELLQECVGHQCLAAVLSRFSSALLSSCDDRAQAMPVTDPVNSHRQYIAICLVSPAQVPTADEWLNAYQQDPECALLMSKLANGAPWSKTELLTVDPIFREHIRSDSIALVNHRLVCYKQVDRHERHLQLIIVPTPLRRRVFEAYHSTPSAGHMGASKTFYRLRLRFLWPNMRTYVEQGCKRCPECLLANAVHRVSRDILYGSVQEQPMGLLHVDAYVPGATESFNEGFTGILVAMCDLTGFVAIAPFAKATSGDFARGFCSQILFRYGLCSRVVVDDDSKLKGVFKEMCLSLRLDYILLSKGNHQGMRCERFNRYLNKVLKIECSKRGTNRVFVEAAVLAAYAWNSMPIDGTDIVRSFVVCGRIFRLPLDIALDSLPEPTDDNALCVQRFLSSVSDSLGTSRQILSFLVDDRRATHRARVNANRQPANFQVGDLVTAQVQVQSDQSQGKVGKLLYSPRGPYEIVAVSDHGSYDLRRVNDSDGAIRSFKGSLLTALPPALQPCNPIDTIDYRFLNQDRKPVKHPLKNALGIDSYNYLWLHGEEPPLPLPDQPAPAIPAILDATNPLVPTLAELDQELDLVEPQPNAHLVPRAPSAAETRFTLCHDDPSVCCADSKALFRAIERSQDRLFFVNFLSDGTMNRELRLVQVDLKSSAADQETCDYRSNGTYYCEFLATRETDSSLAWNQCHWRIEWRSYSRNADEEIEYGAKRFIFQAQRAADPKKYIAYASALQLTCPETFIYGPFDFEDAGLTPTGRVKGRDVVPTSVWVHLKRLLESRTDIDMPPLSLVQEGEETEEIERPFARSRKRPRS
jgi:hypothetical protein